MSSRSEHEFNLDDGGVRRSSSHHKQPFQSSFMNRRTGGINSGALGANQVRTGAESPFKAGQRSGYSFAPYVPRINAPVGISTTYAKLRATENAYDSRQSELKLLQSGQSRKASMASSFAAGNQSRLHQKADEMI